MITPCHPFTLFGLVGLIILWFVPAGAYETKARQVILVDMSTDTVLYEKNADMHMYPASMTKLMTVYMVFEALKNGTLSLDSRLNVSKLAWRKGGSKMFVEAGKKVRIEDLLRGIIVQSGNDATIVIAEGLSGSQAAFARDMTKKAKELGMHHTQFTNASGWPDREHYTTARDLALLSAKLIRDFGEYYHLFSEPEFTFANITQQNRNPLLHSFPGADGLKTGHTEESGYGLAASAMRDGRRLVLVANGMASKGERARETKRLLNWAFREFDTYKLFNKEQLVENIPVWQGDAANVPVIANVPIHITISRQARSNMRVTIRYDSPIAAPIKKNTPLATLMITAPGMETITYPLVAANDVKRAGIFSRIYSSFMYLLFSTASPGSG